MGRILAGNSTSAAVVTLANNLGSISTSVTDSSTKSEQTAVTPGTYWAYDGSGSYGEQYGFQINSTRGQRFTNQSAGVLQDPYSEYTYVQGKGYYSNNYGTVGAVYDKDLNQVYGWGQASGVTPPWTGYFWCARLLDSKLYIFSCDSSGVYVLVISLPSGQATSYPLYIGNMQQTQNVGLVFNWTIDNKFWLFVGTGSVNPYKSSIYTFDVTTNTFSQFGVSYTGSSSDYFHWASCFHVKSDGTAVSVAARNSQGSNGILKFTSTTATWHGYSNQGHFYSGYTGGTYVFGSEGDSSYRARNPVTTDCIIDSTNLVNYAPGSTYYTQVFHLQGGDTSPNGDLFTGSSQYQYPFNGQYLYPTASLSVKDQAIIDKPGNSGTYGVSRSGTTLVIGSLRIKGYGQTNNWGSIASKLSDDCAIFFYVAQVSSSPTHLSAVSVGTATSTTVFNFSGGNVSGKNFLGSYMNSGNCTSFVTSTGKFMIIPMYNSQSSQSISQVVTGSIPVFIPPSTKTYNAVIVGGGGAAGSNVNGTSSSFNGVAAAAGYYREGSVSGSTVFTSGPARGTGGSGYGDAGYGQGEDAGAANQYGGGSGRVQTATMTLIAGNVYPYQAGFGPVYGKQGAVLLSEA